MDKQENVPKLRFKQFANDDAWEQCDSGDVFQLITDYVANGSFSSLRDNVSYSEKNDYAIVVRLTDFSHGYKGPFLYTSKEGYEFLSKSSLKKGDILIANVGSAGFVYRAPDFNTPMTLGPNSILVRSCTNNIDFLYYMLKNPFNDAMIKKQIGIGAQPKFNKTDFRKLNFFIPSINEQNNIGYFFKALDSLITLYQRKLDKLKNLKSAYLIEMFPAEGERKPKRRFAGFTDDWEQCELGDISTEIFAGGDIYRALLMKVGKYPVIANGFSEDGIVGYYENNYRVEGPAVTVTGRGDIGHAKARLSNFTPVVRLLVIKSNCDEIFLENAINNITIYIESTGVPQLTVPQLEKIEILIPRNIKEQKYIGDFFQHLDSQITLHQRE